MLVALLSVLSCQVFIPTELTVKFEYTYLNMFIKFCLNR